jgi:hypothetical protein
MFILCHPTKNEPRKRTKGVPLGTPTARKRRFVISALPKWALRSYLREWLHIQILRWRFDKKTPTWK